MGATVDWEDSTKTVTSKKGSTTIILTIGSNTMHKNDVTTYLDVPAQLIGDYTMVPVRAVAEAFGADVKWDETSMTIIITTTNASLITSSSNRYSNTKCLLISGYDDSDKQPVFLKSFRQSVEYIEEALGYLNVSNITTHYMDDNGKHMSIIELDNLLKNTFDNVSDSDLSIIGYCGHSFYSGTDENGEPIGHTTTFSNASFEEFYKYIEQNIPGTVLIIYDGCFAGELMKLTQYNDRIKIIAACDADDESADYYISAFDSEYNGNNKDMCSIFSYAFKDGIENDLKIIDSNEDKIIDVSELYIYLLNRVYNICDKLTTQDRIRNYFGLSNAINLAQGVQVYPYNDKTALFYIDIN